MTGTLPEILRQFHFLRPAWFLALLPAALLVLALWRRRSGAAGLERLCDPSLLPHLLLHGEGAGRKQPLLMLAAAWLLAVTGLAGPVWQRQPQPVYRLSAARVVVLDLSPSMAAADVTPSRLDRARYKVSDILRQSREGRTGLVVFSGEPHVVVPLTDDVGTIAALLPSLAVDIMPVYGDQASPALELASTLLERGGAKGGEILLVTDGMDDLASAMVEAGKLRQAGRRLSVLGIGTPGGAPVPDPGGTGFALDAAGAPRVARLDGAALRELAAAGGGRYSPMTADDRDLAFLLGTSARERLDGGQAIHRSVERWQEEGAWLVLPILLLALAAFRRSWLAALAFLLVMGGPAPARAMGWQDLWLRADQQAARLLASGHPGQAAKRFADPAWRAVAQHQAGDYQGAIETGKSAADAVTLYNLGNSLAKAGQLEKALSAYDQALRLSPADQDARHNRELVHKLLEERQKGQHEQQQGTGKQMGKPQDHAGQDRSKQEDGAAGGAKQKPGQPRKDASGQGQHQPDTSNRQGTGQQGGTKQGTAPRQSGRTGAQQAERAKPQQSEGANPQQAEQAGAQPESPQGLRNEVRADHGGKPNQDGKPGQNGKPGRMQAEGPGPDQPPGSQQPAALVPSPQAPEDKKKPNDPVLEEWLRQVPDDPSGLLRNKFLLEHQRRLEGR